MVVVPRRRRLPGLDLLISRWRLLPQLRLILPVAVRPKRFFAPLFVFSLGISNPWFKSCGGEACPRAPLAPQQRGRGLPPIEGAGYTGAPSRMQGGRASTAFPLRRVSSVFPELGRSGTSTRIGHRASTNSISRRDTTGGRDALRSRGSGPDQVTAHQDAEDRVL